MLPQKPNPRNDFAEPALELRAFVTLHISWHSLRMLQSGRISPDLKTQAGDYQNDSPDGNSASKVEH